MRKLDLAPRKRASPIVVWLLAVALIGSIYAFWVYPYLREPEPIRVEFQTSAPSP